MKSNLYIDEHIDPEAGENLSEEGFKVSEARKVNQGASDREQIRKATEMDAVIVTQDDDFLRIIEEEEHAGVVMVNKYYGPEDMAEKIMEALDQIPDQTRNFVVYI